MPLGQGCGSSTSKGEGEQRLQPVLPDQRQISSKEKENKGCSPCCQTSVRLHQRRRRTKAAARAARPASDFIKGEGEQRLQPVQPDQRQTSSKEKENKGCSPCSQTSVRFHQRRRRTKAAARAARPASDFIHALCHRDCLPRRLVS